MAERDNRVSGSISLVIITEENRKRMFQSSLPCTTPISIQDSPFTPDLRRRMYYHHVWSRWQSPFNNYCSLGR